MKFAIITGMSGAGKSTVLKMMEDIGFYCALGEEEKKFMEQVFYSLKLSARAYHRILKVARTIADLEGSYEIKKEHLTEAVCYRGFEI